MELTDDQVRQMRRRHKEGEKVSKLALEYGLSYMGASNIITRKTRKDVGVALAPQSLQALHKDLYGIWTMMHVRCTDPRHVAYMEYGGRGIKICDEWQTFEGFFKDMHPRPSKDHTMDRKDANGNYTKDNVQWATKKAQARNKRESYYLKHPVSGEYVPAAEIAEHLGIPYRQMRHQYIRDGLWLPIKASELESATQSQRP